jgi:quercetin dioxygenase-like cupin family protein
VNLNVAGNAARTQQRFCEATGVKRWDLGSLGPSSKKRTPREPGADAPRVPRVGRQMPRVLFSSPECRAVVIDLQSGEELGEHHVRERAVVEVVAGRVLIECSEETVECETGTLVTFDPGEHHTVRALADARLLLLLAPWPAANHDTEPGNEHDQHLPANAMAEPIPVADTTAERPA